MVKIEKITKKFGDFKAVDGVSLEIAQGDFFALLGPNGAGKTTLIRMLVGLAKASEGKIFIDGEAVGRNNEHAKKVIGIVPQHINLDKELSVRENLIFMAKLFRLNKEERNEKIDELLEFVDLKEFENRESKKLSGGMQRKLMIAMALINNPKVLFLDEPTVGIDPNARRKIWEILRTMKSQGKTIIMTTHYIEEADYLCDKVALMDNGKIFYHDSPQNLKMRLGKFTLEVFKKDNKTEYMYFPAMKEAKEYAAELKCQYTLRRTNLEDVFFKFTNRKVL